jgi:hypothetical protein
MPPNPLSTADIPSQFWEDAYLVGKVPFKAASFDQRASYTMYVPKTHYKLDPPQNIPSLLPFMLMAGTLKGAATR